MIRRLRELAQIRSFAQRRGVAEGGEKREYCDFHDECFEENQGKGAGMDEWVVPPDVGL
jgi:hypothetical protein